MSKLFYGLSKEVFDIAENKNIRIVNQSECFACNACVTQCNKKALQLKNKKFTEQALWHRVKKNSYKKQIFLFL